MRTEPIIMPVEVSDLSMAFPADALDYMPAWDDIPIEFQRHTEDSAQWHDFAWTWFSKGLESDYTGWLTTVLDEEKGERIPGEMVDRQIHAILGSYAPKHEHKMAAVAYLMSLWIESAAYGPKDCPKDQLKTIGDFDLDEWLEFIDDGGRTVG